MVTWAAKRLKRPVKWLADRGETFVCDPHGRDHVSVGEMAFDAEGHILGVRVNTHANVGAYLLDFGPRISTVAGARVAGTVYQVPAMQLAVRVRSEEHTSELQSLMRTSYAVFLLKKKTT